MGEVPGQWEPVKPRLRVIETRAAEVVPAAVPLSREERVCLWLLRLLLPVILGLCCQLIFWMWFNDVYGPNGWSIVGGVILVFVAAPVALWTWYSWLPQE
ncbi:hypothetical protein [Enhydrobacter sp.]|jgi:hypothetical protein|uniref:hypothetical protein n=1 Tax=Enhydrobacter sp. TaxID=1894999 RepID=UPI0026199C87|nr:hypothetical protein [Enhydrobacter sp.]WIM11334.1 MAG: hypothetical protein OJF58_002292 [Enhydrobacter sp.]